MDGSAEPPICTSIRHPLQQQLLFRLKEISPVFLDQFDRLYFVLQAAQAEYPSPEAIQILQRVRTLAGEKVYELIKTILCSSEFAPDYIGLLEMLKMRQTPRSALSSIRNGAGVCVEETELSMKAMNEFRDALGDAVHQITTVMKTKRRWRTNSPVFSIENIQAISEIYSAIDECNGVLQECRDYFEEMIKHASDEDLFLTDPPSEGEIQVMQEKWRTFRRVTTSDDLLAGWIPIRESIKTFPGRRRLLPVSAAAVVPSQPPPTNRSNLSIWRRFFRRPARNQSKDAKDTLGGASAPNTPNAASPDRSAKLSSRQKVSCRPGCLSTKTFH